MWLLIASVAVAPVGMDSGRPVGRRVLSEQSLRVRSDGEFHEARHFGEEVDDAPKEVAKFADIEVSASGHVKTEPVVEAPVSLAEERYTPRELRYFKPDAVRVFAPETAAWLSEHATRVAFSAVIGILAAYYVFAGLRWFVGRASAADTPPAGDEHLYARFVAVATACPGAIAVDDLGQRTTYAELLCRADEVAAQLGVVSGDRVVCLLERSLDLVVLHLAVWRCGATVVSLSPTEAGRRVKMICEDCGPKLLVCRPGPLADELGSMGGRVQACPAGALRGLPKPLGADCGWATAKAQEDECCIFFTSGSTGRPKGITMTHRHVMHYMLSTGKHWIQALMPGYCRMLWAVAPSWIHTPWEAWCPLMVGATIVVVPDTHAKEPELLVPLLLSCDVALFIASYLDKLLPFCRHYSPATFRLKFAYCVGEKCPTSVVRSFQDFFKDGTLITSYGLTETLESQFVAPTGLQAWRMPREDLMPVGLPIGAKVLVLDGDCEAEEGEIYFGGSLPRYLACSSAKDHARFVWRDGECYFRTGDLGRWATVLGQRALYVTGRADRQVKVRGMRLELDEVEAALALAGRAAVLKDGDQLTAFIDGDARAFRAEASRNLPVHMRPAKMLEGPLPYLASGKVNYNALQARLDGTAEPEAEEARAKEQLLEEGADSLYLMSDMTKQRKREQDMVNQAFAFCLLGIMIEHWRGDTNGIALGEPGADKFNMPKSTGWVCDVLHTEHMFGTYIVASGLLHAAEPGGGWTRTAVMYLLYVCMQWPMVPLAKALGAEDDATYQQPMNVQRWFLIMLVLARVYTALLQGLRCPPWVQVSAAWAGTLLFQFCSHRQHDLWPEPYSGGHFFQDHGLDWLARPPYLGCAFVGCLFPWYILRLTALHCTCFHYLRHLRHAAKDLPAPHLLAAGGFLAALAAEVALGPLNNHYVSGLERYTGTPRSLGWFLIELVVTNAVSLGLLATCYFFPSRPLVLLGQCTFASFMLHGFVKNPAARLIADLPRFGIDAVAVVNMLAVLCSFTVIAGLLVFGLQQLVLLAARSCTRARRDPPKLSLQQLKPRASIEAASTDAGSSRDTASVFSDR